MTSETMPVEQARKVLGDLVIRALHGGTTVLTRYGQPVAQITPYTQEQHMPAQTSATAWPPGVYARYLTVGGATVDIERGDDYQGAADTVTCIGCGHLTVSYGTSEAGDSREDRALYAERQARKAAQAHAETCRAMPAPKER